MPPALSRWVTRSWYTRRSWLRYFYPFSLLYASLSWLGRKRYQWLPSQVYRPRCSVIVIGNITAGGTGKTPFTLALARELTAQGTRVAIVSRGYGGRSSRYPLRVSAHGDPAECGDEALIYAAHLDCPVMVDPDRVRAVRKLETEYQPEVILSDDGLQHYRLGRDVEIAVIDGQRGLGNGLLLPAGPLRESAARLNSVDAVVINGPLETALPPMNSTPLHFHFSTGKLQRVNGGSGMEPAEFIRQAGNRVHAVAGIGNPERFFSTLTGAGFVIITHVKPDHHRFRPEDLEFREKLPIVMTEKDAVKCRAFANRNCWFLRVEAILPEALGVRVRELLTRTKP